MHGNNLENRELLTVFCQVEVSSSSAITAS